jgi:hypothetical protein
MVKTLTDQTSHHNWVYEAVRPLPRPTTLRKYSPGQRVVSDCSKGVQFLCWWVPDCPDPMGNGFSTVGNSTTIAMHLKHISDPAQLEIGDPVTFGENGNEHAAIVMERGRDPLLWSDGHMGAPNSYRLSYDRRVHQLLKLPVAGYVPSPADKLRAEKGYWAWVQWRLGEGDWASYGKAIAKVRPDVPKIIPAKWWTNLAKFIAARNKPNKPNGPTG